MSSTPSVSSRIGALRPILRKFERLTAVRWNWFCKSLHDGAEVPVPKKLNPLAEFSQPYRGDAIFVVAMGVVALFAQIYCSACVLACISIHHHEPTVRPMRLI